ncbi:helix-turn-helix transcriptional regulator [Zhihengliuella halotolerans]|uniref:Y4mF family transcriptional regulator n=1 Tax=Zhihengliuella halotolerans TaxID=370736 RepID=A0A4Q8ABE7_9MICC|nr:helix-turn-helix transcriptional regulator [Zhihengliuella halotolerans]RZU60849.1 y4mF family transcriptional regulator [Zhihengliuella halotolerans]
MQTHPTPHAVNRVGAVVRAARKSRKLTQAQLAKSAGVSRVFIGEVEAGHERAELGKVLSVLDVLGLNLLDTTEALALIEKGQQLAGHFPSLEALDRSKRVLDGESSMDDARDELAAKWGYERTT